MTCPDRPHDLDLLLAGNPVPESVREHAATCEACAEEAALDARLTAALASRRSVTAPAGLVAAALAEAHRDAGAPASGGRPTHRALAASRPAVRNARPRTLRVAAFALLTVLAIAIAWGLSDSSGLAPEAGDLTAEAPEPAVAPVPALEDEDAPEPTVQPDETTAETPAPAPRRAAAPRRAPRPAPRQTPPTPHVAPLDDLAQNDTPPEPEPSAEEIAQAEADLKLAFALVGDAQDRARRAVRSSADALAPTLDYALPF